MYKCSDTGYIYIACSWQVIAFSILQSPHDVALIFRTCQLHTAWELLYENGGNERSLGVVCPASAVSNARLLGAHCRHSHAEIPRQCEADMSGKTMPHNEETGELET